MSLAPERRALDNRPSLFDHASRLHALTPDAPLPDGGHPYPDDADNRGPRPSGGSFSVEQARAALAAVLRAHFDGPGRSLDELHEDLRALDVPAWAIRPDVLDGLPWLTTEPARETGLWLARHAKDRRPALTGLCLLTGRARPEDVPLVRTLGLLRCLGPVAVAVLETIPGSAGALVWLAERSAQLTLSRAIEAMCRAEDPVAVAWLLRHATDRDPAAGGHALRVAQAVRLADVLEDGEADDGVVLQAGRLLQAMAGEDFSALRDYDDACRALAAFAVRAAAVRPVLDSLASATALAEDLTSGHAALLPWLPGVREATLERLRLLLTSARAAEVLTGAARSPDPVTRRRAAWARRAIAALPVVSRFPSRLPEDGRDRLAIHVVVSDPALPGRVETRPLVNGRPVVARAFRKGRPHPPEQVLSDLAASGEPREVRLAEAYCTEGCCGALYVTIVRDGDAVVWRGWRDPDSPAVGLEPFRFAAGPYDEVVARAVDDHGWEWPARSVAREVRRSLREDPGLLAAWECEAGFVYAEADRQDEMHVVFWHPREPSVDGEDRPDGEPWVQLQWTVPIDDTDPGGQAARVLDWLRHNDLKSHAEVVGGSRELAERLGLSWPHWGDDYEE
ncbi:hypothetical protein [Microbispora amethystogenes]|uniref:HEAT repeat domain-containing protein n=1 Tax=Microbispora amethystogenes TaxID=1427754 RepID=A0ABQ4FI09_9ACTN|nr:hypothetical protein [Microbispora amethystogenes]GIH34403.1 hypothetical protein Mam01_45670 [Microbispora amethystogenes]